jgi:hypothetical protein
MPDLSSVYRKFSAADENIVCITAKPAVVNGVVVSNTHASVRFLKLYNKATNPAATDTPAMTILIPGSGSPQPVPVTFPPTRFSLGLGMRLVTLIADNDATAPGANEVIVHILHHGL